MKYTSLLIVFIMLLSLVSGAQAAPQDSIVASASYNSQVTFCTDDTCFWQRVLYIHAPVDTPQHLVISSCLLLIGFVPINCLDANLIQQNVWYSETNEFPSLSWTPPTIFISTNQGSTKKLMVHEQFLPKILDPLVVPGPQQYSYPGPNQPMRQQQNRLAYP